MSKKSLRDQIGENMYNVSAAFGDMDKLNLDDGNFRLRLQELLSFVNSLRVRLGILDAELEKEV